MSERILPGLTVTFDVGLPSELKDGIEQHVNANIDTLPAWVTRIFVKWDPDDRPGCIAAVVPNTAYRRAYLAIAGEWPDNDARSRNETIIHEFLHVHSWPLVEIGHEMADMIEKNFSAPVVADRLRGEIKKATEQVACDLTELVLRLLKRGDSASVDAGALSSGIPERNGPAIQHGRPEEP